MFLKYIGESETSVWKKDGKKGPVKPWEVFEVNDSTGKQYLNSYKRLFEQAFGVEPKKDDEPKKDKPKKNDDKKGEAL